MIKSASQSSLTNDVKYRSMSVGNVPSSEFLIQTITLDSNAASVTFDVSAFAGVYRHLQIVASFGTTGTANSPAMFFNGITGSSYDWGFLANGASTPDTGTAKDQANMFLGQAGTSSNTDIFGAHVIEILDPFHSSKNTTIRTASGTLVPGYLSVVYLNGGIFKNTAPLTSITFTDRLGASYAAKSRFSIYGVAA